MLNAVFKLGMTIFIYVFIGYLFWMAIQPILNMFKPKEPPMDYNAGDDVYE